VAVNSIAEALGLITRDWLVSYCMEAIIPSTGSKDYA
jgi:hypothetical protein